MKKIIDCPECDGKAKLTFEKKIRTFRKEDYELYEHYYVCENCKEEFTNRETDEVNTTQVYNQYRETHKIPMPEQLKLLKEEYGLNSTAFSKLLGFGVNQFANYEKGEIPNESNATLLNLCLDPEEVLTILNRKKDFFSKNQFEKFYKKLNKKNSTDELQNFKNIFFNKKTFLDKYKGYTIPSFEKFAGMVLFFIDNAPFKTRLNKLLFYSDFSHFKYFGKSISGMEYAAIPMGPVPDQYDIKFSILSSEGFIKTDLVTVNNEENDKFVSEKKFNREIFSESEMNIFKTVLDHFKYKTTKEIISISHKEDGWKENSQNKGLISYLDYGPLLREI